MVVGRILSWGDKPFTLRGERVQVPFCHPSADAHRSSGMACNVVKLACNVVTFLDAWLLLYTLAKKRLLLHTMCRPCQQKLKMKTWMVRNSQEMRRMKREEGPNVGERKQGGVSHWACSCLMESYSTARTSCPLTISWVESAFILVTCCSCYFRYAWHKLQTCTYYYVLGCFATETPLQMK